MLTTEQVARRLGVKPATIYAYVSRGLLNSSRNAAGKGSLFTEAEVEAFAATRRHPAAPGDSPPIHTGLTLIRNGTLTYRGHEATTLARTTPFEAVATLLWTGTLPEAATFPVDPQLIRLAEAVTKPLPPSARLTDRLRVIVAAAAAADPLRFDTAPAAVTATARTILTTMVVALPKLGPTPRPPETQPGVRPVSTVPTLATLLWPRLTPNTPAPEDITTLNAALVLLADHDLAASTLAARVAASTRAHPYAVVGAGLAALDGPLHGAASSFAYALLSDALRTDPLTAIGNSLRAAPHIPGFGHNLYPTGDPRAKTLLALLANAADNTDRAGTLAAVNAVADAVAQRSGAAPNIDLALAAFALMTGMPPDAGEAIFAIARTAGWIAHALEEYGDRPSRFRPTGHYAPDTH